MPMLYYFDSSEKLGNIIKGNRDWRKCLGLDKAYQCYNPIELFHFLLEFPETRRQPVVQRLELLRQLLSVDADPLCQQRHLERMEIWFRERGNLDLNIGEECGWGWPGKQADAARIKGECYVSV